MQNGYSSKAKWIWHKKWTNLGVFMSSKLFSTLVFSLVTTSAVAAVDCKPFKQEAQVKEQIVMDFSYELEKVEKKVQSLESKIADRLLAMDSAQMKINSSVAVMQQIQNEQMGIMDSMQAVEMEIQAKQQEANSLIHTINETQYQINNLPSGSHARRQALRENNRSKKILEKVQDQIVQLGQSIAPQKNRLAQLEQQKHGQQMIIQQAEQEKADIANQKPTLAKLESKKAAAESELINQEAIQKENLKLLDEAQEKVLMCKTYNVKYPLVLDIAKELYQVGCDQYRLRDLNGKHKKDAEAEILATVCNQ